MQPRILGISLGTRHNGLCVLKGRAFITGHVHTINARWSRAKCAAIVAIYERYVSEHAIERIIVKIPKPSHISLAIKQLIRALDEYVKRQGCLVAYTTIEHIKKAEPTIKNKQDLHSLVVAHYPLLVYEMEREQKNKKPYYTKLFEAAIAAHIENIGGG